MPDKKTGTDGMGLGAAFEECEREAAARRPDAVAEALGRNGLLPIRATELLQKDFGKAEWIVTDLIASRGATSRGLKGDLVAGSKMRKTWVALQLALCVSSGTPFLGRLKVPKPSRVLYVNAELREDFAQERIRAMAEELGATLDNLQIVTPAKPYLLRNRRDRDGEKLEGCEDEFVEYVRRAGFEFVIIDPQYKLMFPEEEENTGSGLGGILRFRDRLTTEAGASVMLVHHDTKTGGTDKELTARGAGSGYGGRDYDFRLALDAHKDGDPDHAVLECGSRVRPNPSPVTIVWHPERLVFTADDSIPAERKTEKRVKPSAGETETRNRTAAENAANEVFSKLAKEAEARAAVSGREPEPSEYLLPLTTFRSEFKIAGNIGCTAAKDQVNILLERRKLHVQQRLRRVNGTTGYDREGVVYIGLPESVRDYRRAFGLDPDGDELRRAYHGGGKR